jgi:N-acetylneuraminate lyase
MEQWRGVQVIELFVRYGYLGAAKAAMKMRGVEVGPARLPNGSLDANQYAALRADLEKLGFFDWIKP